MKTVNVDLGENSYSIFIGENQLNTLADRLKKENYHEIFLITDTTVYDLYKNKLLSFFDELEQSPNIIKIQAGEKSKSMSVANDLYTELLKRNATRKSTIVAFGGGVVGDLAGFIASTFMRGVNFVQVPTTILSQVDSSVGGKVGINHPLAKNVIGSFYQPKFVLIDSAVLKTLPLREIKAGFAEVIKYGFIWDVDFLNDVSTNLQSFLKLENIEQIENVLAKCCEIKAAVVQKDEKEAGLRAILNFGHTIGHALEAVTNYKTILHGEGVVYGMMGALYLSKLEGLLSETDFDRGMTTLRDFNLGAFPGNVSIKDISTAMLKDKKRSPKGQLWVLLDELGQYVLTRDVDPRHVNKAIEFVLNYEK